MAKPQTTRSPLGRAKEPMVVYAPNAETYALAEKLKREALGWGIEVEIRRQAAPLSAGGWGI